MMGLRKYGTLKNEPCMEHDFLADSMDIEDFCMSLPEVFVAEEKTP